MTQPKSTQMRGQAGTIGDLEELLASFKAAGFGPECQLNPKHKKREEDPEPVPWILHLWVERPVE